MKFWYDAEFIEDGKTIDLLSIGMVAEDGREFYALNIYADLSKANEWVERNVYPFLPIKRVEDPLKWAWDMYEVEQQSLPQRHYVMNNQGQLVSLIAQDLKSFCDPVRYDRPEFWGYYSAYDHVALCQLFGKMIDLPTGWPFYTRDLRQRADSLGITKPLDQIIPAESEHHALADARWNKKAWEYLEEQRVALTYR